MIVNNSVEVSEQECGTYVSPALQGRRAQGWTLFVYRDGSAEIYKTCAPSGALLGKPIKLPSPSKPLELKVYPKIS